MIDVIKWNRKPIDKPGFYDRVPLAAYHSGRLCVAPSISSSGLRRIFKMSAAHFYDSWPLNPGYEPVKPNDGQILGRACHHLLLGQPRFKSEFVIRPKTMRDKKGEMKPWSLMLDSAKAWVARQEKRGLTVLSPEQVERIVGMAERLAREPLVRHGVLNGLCEITMAWLDEATGVWLLSRPDVIPTDSGDFTDLKTLGSAIVAYGSLVREIGERGYQMQAALVAEGWRKLSGRPMASFSFYFIESRRPYCARMVTLGERDLKLGEQQNRTALAQFVRSMNTGVWPGPGGTQEMVQTVHLSERERMAIEDMLRRQGNGAEP